VHTKVDSWIANTNHKQFFDHYVSGRITILFKDCNYKNETYHVTIT
jgi:hypothetical protein